MKNLHVIANFNHCIQFEIVSSFDLSAIEVAHETRRDREVHNHVVG